MSHRASERALRGNSTQFQPTYYPNFVYLGTSNTSSNGAQGIKLGLEPDQYVITGTYGNISSSGQGSVYIGPINSCSTSEGSGSGSWVIMNVPANWGTGGLNYSTSIYGPGAMVPGSGPGGIGSIELAGTYTNPISIDGNSTYQTLGFLYKGPLTSTPQSSDFAQFAAKTPEGRDTFDTFLHSWSGNLIAGNYTMRNSLLALTLNTGLDSSAFVYEPSTTTQRHLNYDDGSASHTVFGIWYNGASSWRSNAETYTIAGGRSVANPAFRKLGDIGQALGAATLADYDPVTGKVFNLRDYQYNNDRGRSFVTHFEGIYYAGDGIYQMPFTAASTQGEVAGTAYAKRLSDGSFSSKALWHTMNAGSAGTLLSNDSSAGLASVGLGQFTSSDSSSSSTARINPFASLFSENGYEFILQKAQLLT